MPSSGNETIPLCSFCFKSTSSSNTEDDSEDEEDNQSNQKRKTVEDKQLIKGFIDLVQSYFDKPLKNVVGGGHQLSTCQDCRFVIKDFSVNCAKLLAMEKKVKKSIGLLKNVMSSAEKVKSRVATFKSYSKKDNKSSVMITGFRKDFIEKCVQHLSKAPPPIEAKRRSQSISSPLPPPPLSLLLKAQLLKNLQVSQSQQNTLFHSLISSFIVLLLGIGGIQKDGEQEQLPPLLQLDDLSNDLDDCFITNTRSQPQLKPDFRCSLISLEVGSSDNDTVVLPRSQESSEKDKTKSEKVTKPKPKDRIQKFVTKSVSTSGTKRKVEEILSDSENEDRKKNGSGSDSDSESSSSSSEEVEDDDDNDPDFNIIRIPRKKKSLYECNCGKAFKGKGKEKQLENHQLHCSRSTSTPNRSRKRGRGGIASRSESSSLSPPPNRKQGRGRPRKRMRKNGEEEESFLMSTRRSRGGGSGSTDGSSPWQMNLMRVIGSLHK
ncbi:unnamed protein product [Orchesella dallaii]|uniref:ZAD domain-containing protein n=1 Tax=Orchesella dallaii TaxID=48710 RepID=A0ABP1QCX4_9HEXA